MHSLHVSTIFWFLACLWWEQDYNAVPFECWFITQSPCKCDCSLSQESIKQPQYIISFFFFLQQTTYFCSSWSQGICKKSHKEIGIGCSKFVFTVWKHAFPNTVDSIANLSTLDIWPIRSSCFHGMAAPEACFQALSPFPPLQSTPRLALLAHFFVFCFHPVFGLFPDYGA